jgi:predicted Zn-dependent protease
MADRNNGRVRELLLEQRVKRSFRRFIEGSRRLVKEQKIRLLQKGAGDAEPLLLAE